MFAVFGRLPPSFLVPLSVGTPVFRLQPMEMVASALLVALPPPFRPGPAPRVSSEPFTRPWRRLTRLCRSLSARLCWAQRRSRLMNCRAHAPVGPWLPVLRRPHPRSVPRAARADFVWRLISSTMWRSTTMGSLLLESAFSRSWDPRTPYESTSGFECCRTTNDWST